MDAIAARSEACYTPVVVYVHRGCSSDGRVHRVRRHGIDGETTFADANDSSIPTDIQDNRTLALRIADLISDTPAANTLVLDLRAISPIADYFVLCSGENERQLRAISRDVVEKMNASGVRPDRTEGDPASGWIVLDFGDVIVHIFDVDQRAFYRLEDLWAEAPTLLAIQ